MLHIEIPEYRISLNITLIMQILPKDNYGAHNRAKVITGGY